VETFLVGSPCHGRRELKAYERFKEQAQYFRDHAYHLEGELRVVRPELYRADQKIDRLQQRADRLARENILLKRRVADLTAQLETKAQAHWAVIREGQCSRQDGEDAGAQEGPCGGVASDAGED